LTTFDLEDPTLPERTKDAISYSLNQKQYLCEFLNDGKVPIDNGAVNAVSEDTQATVMDGCSVLPLMEQKL